MSPVMFLQKVRNPKTSSTLSSQNPDFARRFPEHNGDGKLTSTGISSLALPTREHVMTGTL